MIQIGDRVKVTFNGLGDGTVIAFWTNAGYMGLEIQPDQRPEWHIKQNGGAHPTYLVFGAEVKKL